jgi:uncharacterized protein with FMN-binding domain
MSVRSTVGGLVTSGSILAVAWMVGSGAAPGISSSVTAAAAPVASGSGSAASGATGGTGTPADGTYTGQTAATRFGDVQVQVTVSGGRITDVAALHLTDHDGHSAAISNRAAPVLRQEVLRAQSAHVQMVSGATYTSEGYLTSLQSALDQAGL